jgi:hypothetical protein
MDYDIIQRKRNLIISLRKFLIFSGSLVQVVSMVQVERVMT